MMPSAIPAFVPLLIDFCAGGGVLLAAVEAVDEVVKVLFDEVAIAVDKVLPGEMTVGVAVCSRPMTLMIV